MDMINLGGTVRAQTPEQTLARLEPLLRDEFGITRVANVTGLDDIGIPTYVVIRPNAKLLSTSQGKGITKSLAKISAIMEGVEGWHAENIAEPSLWGSHHDLCQTHNLCELDGLNQGYLYTKEPEKQVIPWQETLDLMSGETVYIPHSLICLDFANMPEGYAINPPSSNGLASGNTLIEAQCHALFEVVERDCEAEMLKADKPQLLNFDTVASPHIQELLAFIHAKNYTINVWDIRNDIGIPTYYAELDDFNNPRTLGVFAGCGSHLSDEVAMSRAITEAVQARLTFISGSRDDLHTKAYSNPESKYQQIAPSQRVAIKPPLAIPESFDAMLAAILAKLQAAGYHQALCYDHTHKSYQIPVVHVVVPGLEFEVSQHSQQDRTRK